MYVIFFHIIFLAVPSFFNKSSGYQYHLIQIIKVGDLGIARVLDNNSDMATTMIGTPYYMSPELFSNKPYNHKSDVWALGCCLYEMATLKHAFNARDMNALVYKILKGKVPDMPGNYSSELRDIIKSMLNYNPALRPSAAKILRNPYIKKQIAIFLEGTKNRRREKEREEKRAEAKKNTCLDSGFSEQVSNEECIATASGVNVQISDKDVATEQAQKHPVKKNSPDYRKTPEVKKTEVRGAERFLQKEVTPKQKPVVRSHSQEAKEDPSKPAKILSDRIQAKSRMKRRDDDKRAVVAERNAPNAVRSPTHPLPQRRSAKDREIPCRERRPRRELPVLPPDENEKASPLPAFRCQNKPEINNNKPVSNKYPRNQGVGEEAPPQVSAGVPNLSAREKRRLRQHENASSLPTSPTHSYGKPKPKSFVSYQSYTPPPQQDIIRDIRASRASLVGASDVVDSPPHSELSPPESESGEDTLTPSSDRKSSEVNCLIDTLQATLTMAHKSKEHVAPELSPPPPQDFQYDKRSQAVAPTSGIAAGRLRHRIEALRKECVDGIGERLLRKAYEIINSQPEGEVEKMLIDLLGLEKFQEFGGPIWQLKFCEEF